MTFASGARGGAGGRDRLREMVQGVRNREGGMAAKRPGPVDGRTWHGKPTRQLPSGAVEQVLASGEGGSGEMPVLRLSGGCGALWQGWEKRGTGSVLREAVGSLDEQQLALGRVAHSHRHVWLLRAQPEQNAHNQPLIVRAVASLHPAPQVGLAGQAGRAARRGGARGRVPHPQLEGLALPHVGTQPRLQPGEDGGARGVAVRERLLSRRDDGVAVGLSCRGVEVDVELKVSFFWRGGRARSRRQALHAAAAGHSFTEEIKQLQTLLTLQQTTRTAEDTP
eukprot:scaffold11492_cov73-Isochrysis_galbana.AAC.3